MKIFGFERPEAFAPARLQGGASRKRASGISERKAEGPRNAEGSGIRKFEIIPPKVEIHAEDLENVADPEGIFVVDPVCGCDQRDICRTVELPVGIGQLPPNAPQANNLPEVQFPDQGDPGKQAPVEIMLQMGGNISIGNKLIKIEVRKGVVDGEEGLVPRYHVEQPKRYFPKGFSHFQGGEQPAKTPDLLGFGIGELEFSVIKVTLKEAL